MDRRAMDYRDTAATSPLGGSADDHRPQSPTAQVPTRQEFRNRSVLQHRRPDSPAPHQPGTPAARPTTHAATHGASRVETVNLQSILKGAREAIIDFDGAAYRLRITRNHRLILTK